MKKISIFLLAAATLFGFGCENSSDTDDAVTVSADLAHMRSLRKRDEAKVSELEDRVFDEIRQYLDKYISGDPSPVPENKVYLESTLNPTLTSSR